MGLGRALACIVIATCTINIRGYLSLLRRQNPERVDLSLYRYRKPRHNPRLCASKPTVNNRSPRRRTEHTRTAICRGSAAVILGTASVFMLPNGHIHEVYAIGPKTSSTAEPSRIASEVFNSVRSASSPGAGRSTRHPSYQALRNNTADVGGQSKDSRLYDLISGLAGGAASRAGKEIFLHPIDTVRARLQYAEGQMRPAALFDNLYDGVWPALAGGIPAGAAFFATKDVLKGYAKATFGDQYRELTTIAAVFLANLPYWLIRNPAEVLKTQQQAGLVNGTIDAVKLAASREGVSGLYRGFESNVAYAFPTDAIKFVVYEALQKQAKRKLNPLENALIGSAASCVAQFCSTPLDVIRTRIMTQEKGSIHKPQNILESARAIVREEGINKLFSGLLPRLTRALASGAIQFGSYEATRSLLKR